MQPFDIVDVAVRRADDQRPLELAHVLGIDAEVGLQRHFDADALRHVDERSAGPDRGVQRGELVVVGRDDRAEILLDQLRILADGAVHIQEDHAQLLEILAQRVVDHFGLVLRADAGEELALGLGDTQPLEGVLDVVGHFVPRLALLFGGLDVVVDVVEVDAAEIGAPVRHRPLEIVLVRLQTELEHPSGSPFILRDLLDLGLVEPPLALVNVVFLVVEAELIVRDFDLCFWCCDHAIAP